MKKILLSLILFATALTGFAQNVKTGVYTTNPQQNLHVGGTPGTPVAVGTTGVKLVTPTVRVDGLNSTNNKSHVAANGTNSLKRVYATQNGDLVLMRDTLEQMNNQQFGAGALTSKSIILTVLNSSGESAAIKTQSFTLTEPSVVNISATLNVQFSTLLGDGASKIYGAYFRFSSVPASSGISTTANFGRTQKSYTNGDLLLGAGGDFMISPRAELVLPPGTYIVNLYGYVNLGTGLIFTVNFANSTNGENLIITASPTKFQ